VNAAVLGACRWAREALGWDREHLLIYGRSIGTGPAIKAAELGLVGGVVLVSPYTSIRDIVETHVGSVMSLVTLGASDWHSAKNMRNVRPRPRPRRRGARARRALSAGGGRWLGRCGAPC